MQQNIQMNKTVVYICKVVHINTISTPSQEHLVCSRYMQRHLYSFSLWTFPSNLLKAGISYHLQHVLSHRDTKQCLHKENKSIRERLTMSPLKREENEKQRVSKESNRIMWHRYSFQLSCISFRGNNSAIEGRNLLQS